MEVKRYNKFVFEDDDKGIKFEAEALNGNFFEFSERTNGVLSVKACKQLPIVSNNVFSKLPSVVAGEYATVLSSYTDNYGNQAVVPAGWTVSGINKGNTIWGKDLSLVIYRIPAEKVDDIDWTNPDEVKTLQKTYNQLVWTPVCLLRANGTLDGVSFTERFGRRNYWNNEFSEYKFHETSVGELALQVESVKKYGGFYISRYKISKNKKTGKAQSVKGEKPWTNIDLNDAKWVAAMLEKSDTITSHLTFGAEFDSVMEWFIESKVRTRNEIAEDSTEWGNTKKSPQKLVETGSCEEGCTNNIYDFEGNVDEWTQEWNDSLCCYVVRGGNFELYGNGHPVAYRDFYRSSFKCNCTGCRATLYIE